MRWYEYKMEVDEVHASDELKAKLLALQAKAQSEAEPPKAAPAEAPKAVVPAPAPKKSPLRFPSRRAWQNIAAVAALCVVAGGSALLLSTGQIGVGGAKSSAPVRNEMSRSGSGAVSYAMAGAPEVASYALDSTNSADSGSAAVLTSGQLERSAEDSAAQSAQSAQSAKIIYTANLTLESKDYDAARAALDEALADADGYMESSNESTYTGSSRSLSLTLRVPQEHYASFLAAAAQAGNLVNRSEKAEDVTSQYVDLEARLANLKAQRTRLQELQASADSLSDLLEIESSLSDVQYQLESYQSQLDWYSDQVECCTVYISLDEVQTYTPVDESFASRLRNALLDGWANFTGGVQDLAVIIVGCWPAIVIGAIGGVVFYRVRHPRKKRKQSGQ